jgi:acyl-[acyl-carrier-protein]-phospholipid O-acyltransferase / long-chain-fatty-acid--[acyl-carrier-protein] ligase
VLVVIAAAGAAASWGVPRVAAAQPDASVRGAVGELYRTARETFRSKGLLYTVAGIGHFYLLAALLQVQLFAYAQHVLGLESTGAGIFVAMSMLGMAAGSLLAARWSENKVELGLVPLGALVMSAGVIALAFFGHPLDGSAPFWLQALSNWAPSFACVFVLGIGGGLFIVPLQANLQLLAPGQAKGRFQAFGNFVSFLGIFLSAGLWWVLGELGLESRGQALAVGAFSLLGTGVSLCLLPEAFLRLCGWLLAHSIYRIRVLHPERVPETGGALLVANHVSWVDWLVLAAITRRRMRFLIYRRYTTTGGRSTGC